MVNDFKVIKNFEDFLIIPPMPLKIHIGGACSGNPGKGGWSFVITNAANQIYQESGGELNATNNKMDLEALIVVMGALFIRAAAHDCPITVYTSSQYVCMGLKEWVHNWKRAGWKKKDGTDIHNKEMWQELVGKCFQLKVKVEWIKGHSDNELNNKCFALARKAIRQLS